MYRNNILSLYYCTATKRDARFSETSVNGYLRIQREAVAISAPQRAGLTFWHRSFTFNSNNSPTWCKNFSVYYPDVCLQLNMFWAFYRPSSGVQWLQWQRLVLPSYRGDSRAVFVVGPAGPTTNNFVPAEFYYRIMGAASRSKKN